MAETDLWFGTLSATVRVEDLPASRQVVAIELPANGEWRVCGAGASNADGIAMLPITGMPTSRIYAVAIDDWGRPFVPGMTVAFGDVIRPTQFLGWMYQVTAPGEMPSTEPDWWNSMAGVPQPVGTAMMQAVRHYQPIAHGPVGDIEWEEREFDPHWDKVLSLIHFEDSLTDETATSWGSSGNIIISSAQAKFGEYSLSMPAGYGSIMSSGISQADRNWRTGDFTVECFVYCTEFRQDNSARPLFISDSVSSPGITNWQFGPILDGRLCFSYWGGSAVRFETAAHKIILNQWHHIAVVHEKDNNKIKLFVDGVLEGEFNVTVEPQISTSTGIMIGLGGTGPGVGDGKTRGFVDEFRITKGVARYTENFDPPTAPFPNVGPPL